MHGSYYDLYKSNPRSVSVNVKSPSRFDEVWWNEAFKFWENHNSNAFLLLFPLFFGRLTCCFTLLEVFEWCDQRCDMWLTLSFSHLPAGHCHVSLWQFIPLSVHVHGSSRGSLVCCLLHGAPTPFPERSPSPTQVQPLLSPDDGTGQHAAHHGHAPHGQRRGRAERGRHRTSEPSVRCHPGFHIGSYQSFVHNILRIGLHVPKDLHGERRGQRASEHSAPGQWTRLKPRQATERVPLGFCLFVFKSASYGVFCCLEKRNTSTSWRWWHHWPS